VGHDFSGAPYRRCDHRTAGGHRFEEGHGAHLFPGGEDEHVEQPVEGRDVVPCPEEAHRIAQMERLG
jgi:hypothetical protein